mgnify:CR=1 FL=1
MLPVLAVLAAALLFGTTGTAQALGPDGTTPLSVGAARLVIGGTGLAIVALIALQRRRRGDAAASPAGVSTGVGARPATRTGALAGLRIRPRDAALVAVTAVCLVLYQPLFFFGTARNGVAVGTVVALGSAPVIAGVLEWIVRRTAPKATWLSATGLATVGVALLGFGGQTSASAGSGAGTDVVGMLASIGAGASFAVLAVAQRRLLDGGWAAMSAVGAMGGLSALLAFPLLLITDTAWLGSAAGIVLALWLGLITVTLAYALFTWGLAGLTAATAATLTLGEPLTASILGITVLGERLAPLALGGLAVLAAGLVLLAWGSRSAKSPAPFAVEG